MVSEWTTIYSDSVLTDKIFSYIAGREKDLLKEMKPEIPVHLCEKDCKILDTLSSLKGFIS
jgi:hypothetical protein